MSINKSSQIPKTKSLYVCVCVCVCVCVNTLFMFYEKHFPLLYTPDRKNHHYYLLGAFIKNRFLSLPFLLIVCLNSLERNF